MDSWGQPAAKNQGPFSVLRERVLRHSWSGHGLGGSPTIANGSASSSSASKGTPLREQWVEIATDGERWSCRNEDWQRIIAEVRTRDCQWILQRVSERPIMTDHVVAFKALVLLHRVLQQGPTETPVEWGLPNSLLDDLASCWSHSQARFPKGSQQNHCMQAVVEYARLLTAKMELMVQEDAGRGRFTGSLVFDGQFGDPSDLLQALAMLLNFAEKLMPLTLNLVAPPQHPPQDWRRAERAQYSSLYLGAILALLHEAWLLLCAVSLFVKNLLCIVHAQKQREDRSRRDKNSPAPPWLQLALHLLQAQSRFVWFHQSVCDLVAHCHQLRMHGFQELATCIPTVPSSLLNLFADINDLVKPDAKATTPRTESISSVSTTAGSTVMPPEDLGQAPPSSWEPSPLVIDALRTVDSIQPVTESHSANAEPDVEPGTLNSGSLPGSEARCEGDVAKGSQQMSKPSHSSRSRTGKKIVNRMGIIHPFAQGYSLLDDEAEQPESRAESRSGKVSRIGTNDTNGGNPGFAEFTSSGSYVEQAPFVNIEGSAPKSSFVWPETTQPWTDGFDSIEAAPFEVAPTVARTTSFSPPGVAVGSGGPPSWAAAICRTNTNVGSSIQVPIAPLFRNPPWPPVSADQLPSQSARGRRTEDNLSFTTRTPSGTTRSLSVDQSDEVSSKQNLQEGESRGPMRRFSAEVVSNSLNPFEPLTRAKVVTKVSTQSDTSEVGGNSPTPFSYTPPIVPGAVSGFCGNPFWNVPSEIVDPNAGRSVGAPLRIELPGVKARVGQPPPAKNDVLGASPVPPGARNLWRSFGGANTDATPPSSKSDHSGNISCVGGRGFTPREREMQRVPREQSPPIPSPAAVNRRSRARQPSGEKAYNEPMVTRRTSKDPHPLLQGAISPTNYAVQQQPLGPNDWEVNPDELRLEEMVGSGTTAEVYRGSWHGTDVAVKKLRQAGPLSTEFTRELSVLLRLRHPNLVLFMGASLQAQPMIISEFCDGGTVFALLHQRPAQGMPWGQRLKIAIDVAKGMNFLHRRSVVHRDLKSLNLLLASQVLSAQDVPAIKVSDFGLSRMASSTNQKVQACMTSGAGTYHWMAPEVLDGQKYDEKVDVYSYGICLFELIARRIPYDGSGLEPVSIAVAVSKGRRPDVSCIPQNCPADLRFTMECCWSQSPTSRPGFDTILETLKLVHSP